MADDVWGVLRSHPGWVQSFEEYVEDEYYWFVSRYLRDGMSSDGWHLGEETWGVEIVSKLCYDGVPYDEAADRWMQEFLFDFGCPDEYVDEVIAELLDIVGADGDELPFGAAYERIVEVIEDRGWGFGLEPKDAASGLRGWLLERGMAFWEG